LQAKFRVIHPGQDQSRAAPQYRHQRREWWDDAKLGKPDPQLPKV